MDRLYDYTGRILDLGGSSVNNELMPTEIAYTAYRPTFWGGDYRFCGITYDTKNSKFYMVGGSFERDGTSKLVKFSDIRNPLADAVIVTLNTGHSNDIDYDPITDKLLIAGGMSQNDSAGENQYSQMLFFVDPETMAVTSTKTFEKTVQGIACTEEGYYVWRSGSGIYNIELYDSTFTTIVKSGSFAKTDLTSFINNLNPDVVYSQNIAYDKKNKRLYWTVSYRDEYLTGYNNFYVGILVEIDTDTFAISRTVTFNVDTTEEFQNAVFVGDFVYMVCDGQFGTYRLCNRKILTENVRRWISANSDLDNYLSVGEYFSNGAANSATLIHTPTTSYGFSMTVSIQGSYGRRQDVVANSGDRYSRIMLPPNAWGEWVQTFAIPQTAN